MKKNKKNISIFKRIGLIAIALFSALGSLLLPFASHNQNNFASANDTNLEYYSFTGSNYVSFFNGSQSSSSNDYAFSFQPYFYYSPEQDAWIFDFSLSGFVGIGRVNHIGSVNSSESTTITISRMASGTYINTSLINVSSGSSKSVMLTLSYGMASSGEDISEFTGQIYKLEISHYITNETDQFGYCIFKYYDVNDVAISFIFYTHLNYLSALKPRIIYFNLASLSNNQIYQDGFNQGYYEGSSVGFDDGYTAGFSVGNSTGYYNGFDDGVLSANEYSFGGLFASILDVPIKTFSGLFNFQFLGVNLFDFFLGILTFGVIIFVIKLLLGG